MLHDTILALLGIPGDFFIKVSNEIPFKISTKLSSHLHPSELHQLEVISIIGGYYHYFLEFVKKNTQTSFKGINEAISLSSENRQSLYLMSFCFGLEESLKNYIDDVKKIEDEVLSNLYVTLSQFLFMIENYKYLFIYLHEIIDKIETKKLKGAEIFDHLYKVQNSGIPMISECIKIIITRISHVFISWVSSCTLHGQLADQSGEFFIAQKSPVEKNAFYVKNDVGPLFISVETKMKIVYIAEILQTASSSKSGRIFFHDEENIRSFTGRFNELKNTPGFSFEKFANLIDDINKHVITKLWTNISQEIDVHLFFLDFKQIFFFGKGDFYSQFFENVYSFLDKQDDGPFRISSSIRQLFHTSYRQLYQDYDQFEAKFSLHSNTVDFDHLQFKDLFNHFEIVPKIPVSLKLLFNEEYIAQFSDVFKYLFKIKSAQFTLQKLWKPIISSCKSENLSHQSVYTKYCLLRRSMSFFIENVLYYAQDDVIEPLFNQFLQQIDSITDLYGIKTLNYEFIQKIQTELFMNQAAISNQILKIVDLTFSLNELTTDLNATRTVEENIDIVENIKLNYERCSELIFTLLIESIKNGTSQRYKSLLLRLDYNYYYSLRQSDTITEESSKIIEQIKIS